MNDTSLGGPAGGFPATTWGMLSRIQAGADAERRTGLEALCRRYWKPVYRYVRIAWAKTNEDAKDLTQAFFLWLMQDDALRRFDPRRRGFRGFLKLLLSGFVVDQERALHRLKRGGDERILSLDDAILQQEEAEPAERDPEKAFDATWRLEVVRHAVDQVRRRCVASGDGGAFRAYEEYDLVSKESRPTYAELASRLGIGEERVKAHLIAMRDAVREEVRSELSRLTADDRELREEWNELFGS